MKSIQLGLSIRGVRRHEEVNRAVFDGDPIALQVHFVADSGIVAVIASGGADSVVVVVPVGQLAFLGAVVDQLALGAEVDLLPDSSHLPAPPADLPLAVLGHSKVMVPLADGDEAAPGALREIVDLTALLLAQPVRLPLSSLFLRHDREFFLKKR